MGVSRGRRRVIVASACIGALAITGLVVRRLWLTDTARVVDAQEAVDRYRDQQTTTTLDSLDNLDTLDTFDTLDTSGPADTTGSSAVASDAVVPSSTSTPTPAATLPAPGVYRYATAGTESIDVLGGTHHDYPAETLLTVTPEGCGVRIRWDLLKERWEDLAICVTADGIELQPKSTNYHEFFQHGQEQIVQCDRPVTVVPVDGLPRPPEALSCVQAGNAWHPVWEVLEPTTLTVDGVAVDVVHARLTVTDDDEYWEHITADYWFDEHGLPVRMTSTKENRTSSGLVGDVVYHETTDATLMSLTPLT